MIRFRITLVILSFFFTTLYAQNTYQYQSGVEIPLDDFPAFVDGFRIQLRVFASEASARTLADSLRMVLDQSVHLHSEGGLYRVCVGAFQDSIDAVAYRKSASCFSQHGDLSTVKDRIPSAAGVIADSTRVPGFRIQVQAMSDREQALELGRKLDFDLYPDVRAYVIKQDTLYKVQIGDFTSRKETECVLERLKEINGWDLWIVPAYVYKNPPPSPLERPTSDPFQFTD